MLIVIKIGTNSVIGNIPKIAGDIYQIKKLGHDVILVSSGAVGMGRLICGNLGGSPIEKQVLASLGQVNLVSEYQKEFVKYNLKTAQILITKKNIENKKEFANIENMLLQTLSYKDIIPIINENDSVALQELMFTDNDEIAGMLASILLADKLIILTNVDGLYEDFFSPNKKLLSRIKISQIPQISNEKSSMGRGGMYSKISVSTKLAKLGIETTIANIKVENVLCKILQGEDIGTKILPNSTKKTNKAKRRLAFEPAINISGQIIINECLEKKFVSNDVFSVLPIGICDFVGSFKKNDLLEIKSQNNTLLGYGLAGYDSNLLQNTIGKHNNKPFIRYEYMYII